MTLEVFERTDPLLFKVCWQRIGPAVLGCGWVVEWYLALCKVLGLIPDTNQKRGWRGVVKRRHLIVHIPSLTVNYLTVSFILPLKKTCILCVCLLCMHVYLCATCIQCRGHWSLWNWSYTQLWAAMWLLEIEPGSSRRVASALNHWAISPTPWDFFLFSFSFYLK